MKIKKIILNTLLTLSLFFGFGLGVVNALDFDYESIKLPDKLMTGTNSLTFMGYDNYSKYYQVIDITLNKELINDYKTFASATDENTKEAYKTSIEPAVENSIQEENWAPVSNNSFATSDLAAGSVYLVVVKVSDANTGIERVAYKLYDFSVDEDNSTISENEDTGINDTLLVVGVPMLLVVGVYLTAKKRYN